MLVEKPIALTTADADAMVAAARAAGKLLMVGHVLPFFPEFAFALEAVRSGRHGALQAAHFLRVISKPDWSSGIADPERSGGPAIDLHIHDTHFIALLCGMPRGVHSRGVVENGAVVHLTTQYLYDHPNLAVSCTSGALSQAGRPFAHGFELYFERATLAFEFANLGGEGHVAMPLSVILPDGTVDRPASGAAIRSTPSPTRSQPPPRRSRPARGRRGSPASWPGRPLTLPGGNRKRARAKLIALESIDRHVRVDLQLSRSFRQRRDLLILRPFFRYHEKGQEVFPIWRCKKESLLMTLAISELIHPTAVIDPEAILAPDVQVGPYAIIEGPVEIGPECIIEAHACLDRTAHDGGRQLRGPRGGAGQEPAASGYRGEATSLRIGDGNVIPRVRDGPPRDRRGQRRHLDR